MLCIALVLTVYVGRAISGSGGGGGWGGDRELQETPDTVFITGLNENIEEEDLMAHFGSIGVIKVCTLSNTSSLCRAQHLQQGSTSS